MLVASTCIGCFSGDREVNFFLFFLYCTPTKSDAVGTNAQQATTKKR